MIAFSEPRAVSDAHFGRRVRARRFGRECRARCGRPQNSFIARDLASLRTGKSLRARVRHLFEPKYIQNAPLDAPERSQNAPERPSRLLLCLFLGLLFWLV